MAEAENGLEKAITSSHRSYDRDFLLAFQHTNTAAPENLLSSIEAILKGENSGGQDSFSRPGLAPGGSSETGRWGAETSSSLAKRNKSQGGRQRQDIVDIEGRQEIGVLAEDIKSQ